MGGWGLGFIEYEKGEKERGVGEGEVGKRGGEREVRLVGGLPSLATLACVSRLGSDILFMAVAGVFCDLTVHRFIHRFNLR